MDLSMGHGSSWALLVLALALTGLTNERLQTKILFGTAHLRWLLLELISSLSQRGQTEPFLFRTLPRARPAIATLLHFPACSFLAAVSVIIDPVYWWLTCSGVAAIFFARQFALAHPMSESDTFDLWCSSVALSPDTMKGWAGVAVRCVQLGIAPHAAHQTYLTSPFSLDPLSLVCLLILHLARLAENNSDPLSTYAITCVALAAALIVLMRSIAHLNRGLPFQLKPLKTPLVTRVIFSPLGVVPLAGALTPIGLVFVPVSSAQKWTLITLVFALAVSFFFRILASILAGRIDPHCTLSGHVVRTHSPSENKSSAEVFLDHLELGVHRLHAPTRAFIHAYAQWEQAPKGPSLLLFRLLAGLDLLAAALVLVIDMPVL